MYFEDVRTLIASGAYDIYHRVYITQAVASDFFDLSLLVGFDPFLSADINFSMDQAAATCEITLVNYTVSVGALSPLKNVAPEMFWPGRAIQILSSIVPKGSPAGIYRRVFGGRVDNVDITNETMVLQCRGPESIWLDSWVRVPTQYGGAALITVLRNIVQDWAPAPGIINFPGQWRNVTLRGEDPNWVVNPFPQERMSVMQAVQNLVLQIGWDIRHFETDGTSITEAQLYDPGRDGIVPISTVLFNKEFTNIPSFKIVGDDVRNYIEGWLVDRTTVIAQDAFSIDKYGLRYMLIGEDASSNITESAELSRMLGAALADLKEPFADAQIALGYWPGVQLNDVYALEGTGAESLIYEDVLNVAVMGYSHHLEPGDGETTMLLRGKPISTVNGWLDRTAPRMVHVSLDAPPDGTFAQEGAIWLQVEDLDFP